MADGPVQHRVPRISAAPLGAAHHQMLLLTDLEIEAPTAVPPLDAALLIDVEGRVNAVVGDRRRLAFTLVEREVVCAIQSDGTTDRPVEPLVRVRQHAVLDEIGRVELVAAKDSREGAGYHV